jgi:hypothetical protein
MTPMASFTGTSRYSETEDASEFIGEHFGDNPCSIFQRNFALNLMDKLSEYIESLIRTPFFDGKKSFRLIWTRNVEQIISDGC